ncbi:hypothetical protein PV10_01237 [Exophiala mesophila]|uniref:Uncharacterized protein n=1 Tax=Exophiala mesophila TaxID=212818 RepID=A0A0D1ZSI5_EXOME|nr:uncharacterized protein PV10_01237 [Exophiala mesophila]KIV97487.1 hypothetical protein PV10_01237 [Exophiala mesophila]
MMRTPTNPTRAVDALTDDYQKVHSVWQSMTSFEGELISSSKNLFALLEQYQKLVDQTGFNDADLTSGAVRSVLDELETAQANFTKHNTEENPPYHGLVPTPKTVIKVCRRCLVPTKAKLRETWRMARCLEELLLMQGKVLEHAKFRVHLAAWLLEITELVTKWRKVNKTLSKNVFDDIYDASAMARLTNRGINPNFEGYINPNVLDWPGFGSDEGQERYMCNEDVEAIKKTFSMASLQVDNWKPVSHTTCKFISCPGCIIFWFRECADGLAPTCLWCDQPLGPEDEVALYERMVVRLSEESDHMADPHVGCRKEIRVDDDDLVIMQGDASSDVDMDEDSDDHDDSNSDYEADGEAESESDSEDDDH